VIELVQSLKQYFNFYNFERPNQAPDGKTPAELYFGALANPEGRSNFPINGVHLYPLSAKKQ